MAIYTTRLHIKVKDIKTWDSIKDKNFDVYELYGKGKKVINCDELSFVIDGDWSSSEYNLLNLIRFFVRNLDECIIIADSVNRTLEDYQYYIYYLGDKIQEGYYYDDDDDFCDELFMMASETNIYDIRNWITYGKFNLSEKEAKTLNEYI